MIICLHHEDVCYYLAIKQMMASKKSFRASIFSTRNKKTKTARSRIVVSCQKIVLDYERYIETSKKYRAVIKTRKL